jgi:hypothetical protein
MKMKNKILLSLFPIVAIAILTMAAESPFGYAPKFGDSTGTNWMTWSNSGLAPTFYVNGTNYTGITTNRQFLGGTGITNTLVIRNGYIVDIL